MRMIAKALNEARNNWAGTERWFFYGNDPPTIKSDLKISYEREIWAQWMRSQNIKVTTKVLNNHGERLNRRYIVESDSGFFTTKAVQNELLSVAVPNLFDMSTWDYGLGGAVTDFESADHENDIYVVDLPNAQFEVERKATEDALQRLLKWASEYRPVGPLDYGAPRRIPLPPIEWYTGRFSSYKSG